MCFAGCACLLVRDVVCCPNDANSVQNRLQNLRSVQFPCLIGSIASSFSSVQGTAAKSLRSVRSVQFIQFSSRTLPALILGVRSSCLSYMHNQSPPKKYECSEKFRRRTGWKAGLRCVPSHFRFHRVESISLTEICTISQSKSY